MAALSAGLQAQHDRSFQLPHLRQTAAVQMAHQALAPGVRTDIATHRWHLPQCHQLSQRFVLVGQRALHQRVRTDHVGAHGGRRVLCRAGTGADGRGDLGALSRGRQRSCCWTLGPCLPRLMLQPQGGPHARHPCQGQAGQCHLGASAGRGACRRGAGCGFGSLTCQARKHLTGGLVHNGHRHLGLVFCVGSQQCPIAQQVDAARHAPRPAVDAQHGLLVEQAPACEACHLQTVLDVLGRLWCRQRIKVVTGNHPLRQLLHVRAFEHVAQFRLADQDDLQQLALVRLQVRQQAQLLEHLQRQVLCLIDDEHVAVPFGMAAQQVTVEQVDVGLHPADLRDAGAVRQVEFLADGLQQLRHGQLRVEDVGHMAAWWHLLQKAATHRRLAGTDFPGQQHEAAASFHAIQQVRQGLAVAVAHEQIAWIGGDRKGWLCQAKK